MSQDRCVDELIAELEHMDSFCLMIDKDENNLPFYRYNQLAQLNQENSTQFIPGNYDMNSEDEIENDDNDSMLNQSNLTNEENIEVDNNKTSTDSSDYDSSSSSSDGSNLENSNNSINSDDSDCLLAKTKRFKYSINRSRKTSYKKSHLRSEGSTALKCPENLTPYTCPLNNLLYHINHHHQQSTFVNKNSNSQLPMHSYHNNVLHHNHYEHLNNLSRSSISLMLVSELVSTDGADFDWTPYLPIMFHTCFINFDNTKQLIGEHSKKLFLNTLYVLTIQTELYGLSDYLLGEFDSVLDNQSIVYDRKYTNNNYVDGTSLVMSSMYNQENRLSQLSVGNCHYSYNYNSNVFSNLKGNLFNEMTEKTVNSHRIH